MTEKELADWGVLCLANNEEGKFGLELSYSGGLEFQLALERGMTNDWFRLIDVSPVATYPGRLFRMFMLTPAGRHRRNQLEQQLMAAHWDQWLICPVCAKAGCSHTVQERESAVKDMEEKRQTQ